MEEFKRDKMFDWKEFERVYSVIKLLRETSSSNTKASILKQYKDTPHLQDLLYYTYNKDLKYKITLKAISKAEVGNIKSGESPFELASDLAMCNIDNATRNRVATYLANIPNEKCRELVLGMLLKDLGIHMTAKSINKVIPNLIPEFKVALANPIAKAKLKIGEHITVTQKLNGIRGVYYMGGFKSRQGKDIDGFDNIKRDIEDLFKYMDWDNMVLDGELVRIKTDDIDDEDNFRLTTSIVNSKSRTKDEEEQIEFVIFDLLPYDEFVKGESTLTHSKRNEILEEIDMYFESLGLEYLRTVPCYFEGGYDPYIINNILRQTDAIGLEGVMINRDATYKCKRSNDILKVKSFFYNDLRCLEVYEGEGEFEGTLGGIVVNYKGFKVKAGSGFTQEQREYYWTHPEEIVGRIVCIKCKGESKNKNNSDLSMNFPIFNGVRNDKEEESYEI